MTERDPILGYCIGCPRAVDLLRAGDGKRPIRPAMANINTAVLVSLGEQAIQRDCQGPVPDISYDQPVMKCGLQEGQPTIEDMRRMRFDHEVRNLDDNN